MYGNSHTHTSKVFQLHLTQWDVFIPYEKHMIKYFKESYHTLMKR